jgi:uncharacterized BrkB/YihY/UPF0761 family membrane protein
LFRISWASPQSFLDIRLFNTLSSASKSPLLLATYGAAASIVVLLIWVYYSAQIVLFGAEVTHVLGAEPSKAPQTGLAGRA